MTPRILIVQDDLFFAARARDHAERLGLPAELVRSVDLQRTAAGDDIVLLQVTLKSEEQLALIEKLKALPSPPTVLAVSGHLETDLRRKAKALGARIASNSDLEKTLAKLAGVSDGRDARGDRGA